MKTSSSSAHIKTPPGFTSTLVFSDDDPANTVISELIHSSLPTSLNLSSKDGMETLGKPETNTRPIYSIRTTRKLDFSKARGGVKTLSEIRTQTSFGGDGELVATWEWKDYASDIVAMRSRGMQQEALSKWLKKGFVVFSR